MKLTDLHNHTTFSYDGTNSCEEIIENALSKGIEVIGITDHQYSISDIGEYIYTINECKRKYGKELTNSYFSNMESMGFTKEEIFNYLNKIGGDI
jgi:histidinol phosphatase-like PHP family hydrolase